MNLHSTLESHSSIASAPAFLAPREGFFALRSRAFAAHSMAMALRSPLSMLTRAARFLTCGADFLCLPVRWSGRFVWRLRFAKPADFLLFLFVAPIVCMIDVRTDWNAGGVSAVVQCRRALAMVLQQRVELEAQRCKAGRS